MRALPLCLRALREYDAAIVDRDRRMARPSLSLLRTLVVAVLSVPVVATAFTTSNTRSLNVREGPGTRFPVQAALSPGTSIWVYRCNHNWRWCEIRTRRDGRGWVDARFLDPSARGRVPVIQDPAHGDRRSRPVG